ncbi:MAG: carboxyl transferase domain-containing protein, partial [Kibdelosporangium sp.]
DDPERTRLERMTEYKEKLMHPYYAAENGLVDDVIDPAETREILISTLAMLRTKRGSFTYAKHGNPPV